MMLYFVLTILLAGDALALVPAYIRVCGRRNPALANCILNSTASLIPMLKNGISALDVPGVEPLTLDEIVLADTPNFKAIAQKVKLRGFTDFTVKALKADLVGQRIDIDIAFKKIGLDAEYDVLTRVIVLIAGKGPINIVAEDVTAEVTLKYNLVKHKGAEYLYFTTMTTKLNIKDYTSHFKSREGSDGAVAEGINAALSGDRPTIIKTITPNLEKVISERILKISNDICKHFTYEELFPDRE